MSRPTALIVAAAVLTSVPLALVLFGSGSESGGSAGSLAGGAPLEVDGFVASVGPSQFVLQPFAPVDGEDRLEFSVRREDASMVDVPHLAEHAALGTPVKILYRRDDDELGAVGSLDLPFTPRTQR